MPFLGDMLVPWRVYMLYYATIRHLVAPRIFLATSSKNFPKMETRFSFV